MWGMTSEHPAMELARRGPKGKGDTFLGFWLEILTDGRQAKFEASRRRTQKTIDAFFRRAEVVQARQVLGDDAVAHELRDAAALFFHTCLTDVAYTSTLFGAKRVSGDQVVLRAAKDTADAVAVIVQSNAVDPLARRLPSLLLAGFVSEIGSVDVLRRALLANRSAAPFAEVLEED